MEYHVISLKDGETQRVVGDRWVYASESQALSAARAIRKRYVEARFDFTLIVFERRGPGRSDRTISVWTRENSV